MKYLFMSVVPVILLLVIGTPVFSQDYNYYNDQAKTEYDKKNYYAVIENANRSLDAYKNGAAYWYRGMGRFYLNNYTDAASDFDNAISYYSDNTSLASLYYWRASCRYNQKNYKQAVGDFESAKSYGYENKLNMNWCMAFSNYSIGEYKKAIDNYTSALDYSSDRSIISQLYKGRGDVNYELFKLEDAISDYSKAIENNSDYAKGYWARGIARAMNFQNELAIGDYTAAINIIERENKSENANDLSILYSNRGRQQYILEKYEESKADLQKSLNLNPNNDKANWNMADLLFALKNYKEASRYYLQTASLLTKNSDQVSVYTSLSQCSVNQLDYLQALNYINTVIKINPDYGDVYARRGHILFVKKDYAASLNDFDRAIVFYENDKYAIYKITRTNLYIERADVKTKMKNNTGALADFQKAVQEDTGYVSAIYHLGRFYKMVLKQNTVASVNLQKVLNLCAVKDTESWYIAEYAYAKVLKGEKQEAFTVITKLIKKDTDNKERLKWDLYDAACIYALAADPAKALQYLDKAFAAGFDNFDHFLNDSDLDSLRQMPAYKSILAKYKLPPPKL